MIFEFYLGTRFFRKRLINFLAIGVVAFSVLMPVVVLAVMEGFSEYMQRQIRGALSDVIIGDISFDAGVENPRMVSDRVNGLPETAGSSPFIRSFVIIKNRIYGDTVSEPVLLQGFDPEYEYRTYSNRGSRADLATELFGCHTGPGKAAILSFLRKYPMMLIKIDSVSREVAEEQITDEEALESFMTAAATAGGKQAADECRDIISAYKISWQDIEASVDDLVHTFADTHEYTPDTLFAGDDTDEGFNEIVFPEAFLNVNIARKLGISPGGSFVVTAVGRNGNPVKRKFRMKGALRPYSAAKGDRYDMPSAVISFEEAGLLFGTGGNATGISVWLCPETPLRQGADAVREATRYTVYTWKDLRYNILRAVENENRLLRVVLLCIAVAGGFAILAITYTSVSEKIKDIGILKAVGITPFKIITVFMGKTIIIGLCGTALGALAAYLVVDNINWLSEAVGWTPFSGDIYYLPSDEPLPVSWEHAGVWFFSVSSFIICMFAGLYPAVRAASLNAADAIRND